MWVLVSWKVIYMYNTSRSALKYQQECSQIPAGVLSSTSRSVLEYQQECSLVSAGVFLSTSRSALAWLPDSFCGFVLVMLSQLPHYKYILSWPLGR